MHLQRLTVRNFRAFEEATVDLPENGLVLLAGPNSVGKSSLFSALDVVAGVDRPAAAQHMAGGDLSIRARFLMSQAERQRLRVLHQYHDEFPDADVATWIEWEFTADVDGTVGATSIATNWENDTTLELVRERRIGPEIRLEMPVAPLANDTIEYRMISSTTGSPPPRTLENNRSNDLEAITGLLADWRGSYFHFPAVRGGSEREQRLTQVDKVLAPSGQNLGAVLLDLKVNEPHLWKELQGLIAAILPEIGTLEISITGSVLSIGFADSTFPGHRHNLRDLGAGVEQVLLAAVVGIAQPHAAFVAVEEPETALHPAAQRAMIALFGRWSRDRLFALTTHSPIFLDRAAAPSRIYALSRSNGVSEIKPADPKLFDVLDALGVRPSDVLSAERLLLVEGPSDRDVLAAWWPQLVEDPRIAVITGQGGRNARFARLLDQWIQEADRHNRRVLYIRDRDELDSEAARKLGNDPTVHLLARREVENYLLEAGTLVGFFASQGTTVAAADVETATREAADALRRVVIVKSVAARLGPVRLVDDALRRDLARNAQNASDMVAGIVPKLPVPEDVERQIRECWSQVEEDVASRWEHDWRSLAPGEEVLRAVFQRFLGRGYGKTADAGALARFVSEPPQEIAEAIGRFLATAGQ